MGRAYKDEDGWPMVEVLVLIETSWKGEEKGFG
jgi:hypothetical protein